jgi:hypothetical protein
VQVTTLTASISHAATASILIRSDRLMREAHARDGSAAFALISRTPAISTAWAKAHQLIMHGTCKLLAACPDRVAMLSQDRSWPACSFFSFFSFFFSFYSFILNKY